MGTNKATLLVDGQPLAVRVADVLASAGCAPVWFQGGDPAQLEVLSATGRIVADLTPGSGPVGAIASALVTGTRGVHQFADQSAGQLADRSADQIDGVLIAACDLVDLDVDTVRTVIDTGEVGVVAIASDGGASGGGASEHDPRWQMVSWWSVELAGVVVEAAEDGVTSYRGLLRRLQQRASAGVGAVVRTVAVAPAALTNLNTPSDLDARGGLGSQR